MRRAIVAVLLLGLLCGTFASDLRLRKHVREVESALTVRVERPEDAPKALAALQPRLKNAMSLVETGALRGTVGVIGVGAILTLIPAALQALAEAVVKAVAPRLAAKIGESVHSKNLMREAVTGGLTIVFTLASIVLSLFNPAAPVTAALTIIGLALPLYTAIVETMYAIRGYRVMSEAVPVMKDICYFFAPMRELEAELLAQAGTLENAESMLDNFDEFAALTAAYEQKLKKIIAAAEDVDNSRDFPMPLARLTEGLLELLANGATAAKNAALSLAKGNLDKKKINYNKLPIVGEDSKVFMKDSTDTDRGERGTDNAVRAHMLAAARAVSRMTQYGSAILHKPKAGAADAGRAAMSNLARALEKQGTFSGMGRITLGSATGGLVTEKVAARAEEGFYRFQVDVKEQKIVLDTLFNSVVPLHAQLRLTELQLQLKDKETTEEEVKKVVDGYKGEMTSAVKAAASSGVLSAASPAGGAPEKADMAKFVKLHQGKDFTYLAKKLSVDGGIKEVREASIWTTPTELQCLTGLDAISVTDSSEVLLSTRMDKAAADKFWHLSTPAKYVRREVELSKCKHILVVYEGKSYTESKGRCMRVYCGMTLTEATQRTITPRDHEFSVCVNHRMDEHKAACLLTAALKRAVDHAATDGQTVGILRLGEDDSVPIDNEQSRAHANIGTPTLSTKSTIFKWVKGQTEVNVDGLLFKNQCHEHLREDTAADASGATEDVIPSRPECERVRAAGKPGDDDSGDSDSGMAAMVMEDIAPRSLLDGVNALKDIVTCFNGEDGMAEIVDTRTAKNAVMHSPLSGDTRNSALAFDRGTAEIDVEDYVYVDQVEEMPFAETAFFNKKPRRVVASPAPKS